MAKYCGKCGAKVQDEEKFCSRCGSLLISDPTISNDIPKKTEHILENVENISSKKDFSKKKLVGIIGIVIVFALIGSAGYYWKTNSAIPEEKVTEQSEVNENNTNTTEEKKVSTDANASTQQQPATSAEAAQQVFQSYHKAITDKQYAAAYNLMTTDLQQQFGSLNDYTAGFSTTISSEAVDVAVASSDNAHVTLSYILIAKDRTGSQEVKVQRFKGSATFIKLADGSWKINSMSAEKLGEYMEK